ncbi:NAD-dependent epimerase/dehydratase family protein [Aureimonas psammosilenae]|uniref:NAD-dependent epimerase/dehydratase family protein n=1 Tax=Aureimonas psammosilenae TaxID=2495496 RepID=UPI001260F1AC|nr:NAD-dependent epimerase/dehydratase family protein [Aureimonas psammosilenae]
MRILVTGAGGFVGRHLVERLAAEGHDLVLLRRGQDGGSAKFPSFVGPADLAGIDTFSSFPEGIEAIAHLAALNPMRGDPAASDLAALRHANVAGTAALARRAVTEGVRRVVLVGSASVHGATTRARSRETDPLQPQTPYARSKAEGEDALWQALGEQDRTTACVLRPAAVFGPGGRNAVATLARLARLPLPLPLGGLGKPRSLIGVDSLARAIALALTRDEAAGETFLVADDGPLTPADIVAALREGLGRKPGILPAPSALLGMAARLGANGKAWERLRQSLVLDNGAIRGKLGWQPGIARETLQEMMAEGSI